MATPALQINTSIFPPLLLRISSPAFLTLSRSVKSDSTNETFVVVSGVMALASEMTDCARAVDRPVKIICEGEWATRLRMVVLPQPEVPVVSSQSVILGYFVFDRSGNLPPVMTITFPDRFGISFAGSYSSIVLNMVLTWEP